MPSNHLILSLPVLLCPQIFPASGSFPISQLFPSGNQNIGASAPVLPVNIQDCSFRIDWFDFLAVQGTLKNLLQHHSLKASILWSSAFFMVQLSYPYMITGKTVALTRWTFVGKVISLLFNTLSRFVLPILSRSKSFCNFVAAVTICSDFGVRENEICHCFHIFLIYLP